MGLYHKVQGYTCVTDAGQQNYSASTRVISIASEATDTR